MLSRATLLHHFAADLANSPAAAGSIGRIADEQPSTLATFQRLARTMGSAQVTDSLDDQLQLHRRSFGYA